MPLVTTNKYLHAVQEADEQAANILQDMFITQKKRPDEQAEPQNIQKNRIKNSGVPSFERSPLLFLLVPFYSCKDRIRTL